MCRLNAQEQYDRILKTFDAIPLDGSISVLTGRNGSGKSLIRQQLTLRAKKLGKTVVHSSMALRTGTHSHLGGLGCLVRDAPDSPTSYETFRSIQQAIRSIDGAYLCLDEIEIGCARETVMGLVGWLNEHLRAGVEGSLGCLVITHSEFVIKNLEHDNFFSLDGYNTEEEWVNRDIIPTDMEALGNDSRELFRFVSDRTREKKEKRDANTKD